MPVQSQPLVSTLLSALLSGRQAQNPAARRALAKIITCIESTTSADRASADQILNALMAQTGTAIRIGISGVPGVGKSTLIESLGVFLIAQGHRVAVLAIDPSSSISGGSILGDKTRMERLSVHPQAFIRPSPSSGNLGGVAEKTRETMLVCEAAGYDVILVETVGVGQSEIAVSKMTDMFILLQLPNAGDDLQAIKKGVMEIADLVVVNKQDLNPAAAELALSHIRGSLRSPHSPGEHARTDSETTPLWHPQGMTMSALEGRGLELLWENISQFMRSAKAHGTLSERRTQQAKTWLWERIQAGLAQDFKAHAGVAQLLPQLLQQVERGEIAASVAARHILEVFKTAHLAKVEE